jgi:UDP-glucose 4-epimerase
MHEDMVPRPLSPYGASKLSGEAYCSAFYGSFDLKTVSLRFSNVYGPGSLNKGSVVALFFKRIQEGKPLIIYGDGEQTRDFIYVDDICKAIYTAFNHESGRPDRYYGTVYQVGTGTETSINQLAGMIKRLVESTSDHKVEIRYAPERKGEIKRNYSRIDKFSRITGFVPEYTLEKGLVNTWEFFKSEFRKSFGR